MRPTALPIFLLVLLLAGCVTSYGSGPNAFTGGVGAKSLGAGLFEVRVDANGYTSQQRALEMLHLKSAEVALENGAAAFEVLSDRNTTRPGSVQEVFIERGGFVERLGRETRNAKPGYRRTIRLWRSLAANDGSRRLYSARAIYSELAPRYIGTTAEPRLNAAAQRENDEAMARLANCKRDRPEVWRTNSLRCMYD